MAQCFVVTAEGFSGRKMLAVEVRRTSPTGTVNMKHRVHLKAVNNDLVSPQGNVSRRMRLLEI